MDTASDDAGDANHHVQIELPYEEWRDHIIAKAKHMLAAKA